MAYPNLKRIGKILFSTGVIVLTVAVPLFIQSREQIDFPADRRPASRPVRVSEVVSLAFGPRLALPGITRAVKRAKPAFSMTGRLVNRPVSVGDAVKKGAVLARLEPDALESAVGAGAAAIEVLNTRIAQAMRDVQRIEQLKASGAVSPADVENAVTLLKTLLATKSAQTIDLDEARRKKQETVLRAPFDGVVQQVFAEPGEVVAAGMPILKLDGNTAVEAGFEVPESVIASFAEGNAVTVSFPLMGYDAVTAVVTSVGKSADESGGLFPVIVTLPEDPRLKPGLTVTCAVPSKDVSGIAVDISAIVNPTGERAWVLRVRGGVVEKVPVETGDLVDGKVAVEGALNAGDWVVCAGHSQLFDGDEVSVR